MFSALKRLLGGSATSEGNVAAQPPGAVFPWPQSTVLTALEEVVIGIPAQIVNGSDVIGSVIRSDPGAQIHIPTNQGETMILLKLKAGMSASLTKSCQAVVLANDKRPRRIRVGLPGK